MRMMTFKLTILAMAVTLIQGCGKPPDTDVTSLPKYGFASFSGTEK